MAFCTGIFPSSFMPVVLLSLARSFFSTFLLPFYHCPLRLSLDKGYHIERTFLTVKLIPCQKARQKFWKRIVLDILNIDFCAAFGVSSCYVSTENMWAHPHMMWTEMRAWPLINRQPELLAWMCRQARSIFLFFSQYQHICAHMQCTFSLAR